MELLKTEAHMYLLDMKSSPTLIVQNNNRTFVFHQIKFVDKNNLEAQNPRRVTSILSVIAGSSRTGSVVKLIIILCSINCCALDSEMFFLMFFLLGHKALSAQTCATFADTSKVSSNFANSLPLLHSLYHHKLSNYIFSKENKLLFLEFILVVR